MAPDTGAEALSPKVPLANVVVVLNEPKDLVNIAGVVRVMMNMGLSRLRLVSPDAFDGGRIEGIAHRSRSIIEATEIHDALPEALADATHVVGTSARARAAQTNAAHPRTIASGIVERAAEGLVAVVFGREDRGLSNEALDLCHEVVVIPTDSESPSLNLAQACLVICYELLLVAGAFEREESLGKGKRVRMTPPATQGDLERMYEALENGLARIEFYKAREPAAVLRTLRTLLGRAEPSLRETKLLQAIGFEIGYYLDRIERERDD